MFKFSANLSMLFTELAWLERFQAAKQQGFTAVEIQFPYHLPAETILAALNQHALKLVLFNVDADDLLQGGEGLACVPEKRGQFRQAVAQAMAYARVLQPEAINVLPGRCLQASRYDEYLATFKENLAYAAAQFATLGINTVFEAINNVDMPGFIVADNGLSVAIWEELRVNNPKLFLQYDVYHSLQMGENPLQIIADHADKIGHIQFADQPGRGQPGTGSADFAAIFAAIGQSDYAGWLGAEYKPVGATAESLAWLAAYC